MARLISQRRKVSGVSLHRRRGWGAEPATCRLGGRDSQVVVESGGAGTAHRPAFTGWASRGRFRSSISLPKAPSRRACCRIAFHQSHLANALDSGQPEVFLGSSRRNKFVETGALIEPPITRTIRHTDSLTAAYTHNCEALVVVSVSSVAEPTSSKAR